MKKITLRIAGEGHTGRLPFRTCEYIEFAGVDCPLCAEMTALVKEGKVMALFTVEGKAAHKEFPGCVEEKWEGPLKVRLPFPSLDGPDITGDAQCTRCRQMVGPLTAATGSLFGVEEDMRVLSGRCRVY